MHLRDGDRVHIHIILHGGDDHFYVFLLSILLLPCPFPPYITYEHLFICSYNHNARNLSRHSTKKYIKFNHFCYYASSIARESLFQLSFASLTWYLHAGLKLITVDFNIKLSAKRFYIRTYDRKSQSISLTGPLLIPTKKPLDNLAVFVISRHR